MNALLQSLRNLGPVRLAVIAAVGIGVVAFFVYLMTRMATPPMDLLYGQLEPPDANRVVTYLEDNNIRYELRSNGTEVWVPSTEKDRVRVKIAEHASPGSASVGPGYEIFDNQDVFGSTNFTQNVNLLRALEGELSRTIAAIESVRAARVHLVLPRRQAFSREEQEPSASIVVQMEGGRQLSPGQVRAVQNMVAAAVPKLVPQKVSVVDGQGNLLARSFDDGDDMLAHSAQEMRLNHERRLSREIEDLLARSVGPGRVRAEVTVEMDMDRISTTEEVYDPEGQVVRSSVTVEEERAAEDSDTGAVSVAQNLPDADLLDDTGATRTSNEARTEETVNYEISRTVRNRVKQLGGIKRLSVAVLVDGTYAEDADGNRTYEPRSDDEMSLLTELVQSAVGYDPARGDQVSVVNMRFAQTAAADLPEEETGYFGLDPAMFDTIVSQVGTFIVLILFVLLILKPLVSRAIEAMSAAAPADDRRMLPGGRGAAPVLAAPGEGGALEEAEDEEEEGDYDDLIDIDKVEGRVKASSIRKIGEIVDKHPEEALSIIRNWMYQET